MPLRSIFRRFSRIDFRIPLCYNRDANNAAKKAAEHRKPKPRTLIAPGFPPDTAPDFQVVS